MKKGKTEMKSKLPLQVRHPFGGEHLEAGLAQRVRQQARQLGVSAASLMHGSSTAEFDAEKVSRISQSIADGSYKINAEVIADKLIANAQELLGKVQR